MDERFRFRVWNETEKKYLKMAESHCDNVGFFLSCMEDEVLEQCTGLKDKKGKLIYSGDIVIWNDGGGECELKPKKGWIRIAEVKLFPDLHFKIIGCYPKRTCEIGHEFHFGNFIYKETEKYLKIIGNIHENADLLNS